MDKWDRREDDFSQEAWEPDSPGWLWALAAICWAISVYTMYQVEHTLYGGIVDTNTFSYAVAPLGIIFAREDSPEKADGGKWKKTLRILGWIAILSFFAAGFVFFIRNGLKRRYFVSSFQLICLFLFLFLPKGTRKKMDSAWGILLVYAVLAIATLAAPRIAGYTSVPEAAAMLREQGYHDVMYQQPPHGYMIADSMPGCDFTEEEWEEPVYLFSAKKGGRPWAAAVSPVRGVVAGNAPAPEGSDISSWLEVRE